MSRYGRYGGGSSVGVVSGSNSPLGCLAALGTTDLRPVDLLTPTISVTSAERKVTTPMTVTATAAAAGGAGLGLAPGPVGGDSPEAGVAAGAEGGGPGLSLLAAPAQSLPDDPDLPHPGGPEPGPGPDPGLAPGPGRGLEAGAGLDQWVGLTLDLQLEASRPREVLLTTDEQLKKLCTVKVSADLRTRLLSLSPAS
ncbi:uncharacterized protein LOC108882309 isoform X5 [Lates calcarifer]|uniref:Uncharacterized protein LOC108882309 isoform X5 n=1 Tax=Lates calcarifer TaxID=8187 RepID=A0AAJ7LRH6_LATCA|nr:uncharacterized protein LOC108882309 isoform X5 [Lates calcarifer]